MKYHRAVVRLIFEICLGACLGLIIGNTQFSLAALTILVPIIFFRCLSRLHAFCFIFVYYGVASRAVPAGAAVFFGENCPAILGYLLWFSANLVLVLFWTVTWMAPEKRYFVRYLFRLLSLFAVITIPPIGVFSWASPLVSCGYLFPGTGWVGILIFFLLVVSMILVQSRESATKCPLFCWLFRCSFFLLLIGSFLTDPHISTPTGWVSIDTSFGKAASGSIRFTDSFIRSTNIIPLILQREENYILVPETIAGIWTTATQMLWMPVAEELLERGQTLVLGAEILDVKGQYDNCMLFLGTENYLLYKQRIPVPFSMWIPFGGSGSANAYWWDSGRVSFIDGRSAVALICYEQFLAWPILRSMATLHKTDILLCSANQWWSRETCIPIVEQQYARSWSLLFNLELVSARNM